MAGFNFAQNIIGLNKVNKELTENKVDWVSNGVLGAKNLNSYPYFYENGQELSQVIWTVSSDGILIANGTATGTASSFICHSRGGSSKNKITIPNGKYIITGCPSGGSDSTYYIGLGRTKNGAFESLGFDYGDGAVIILNGDDFSNEKVVLQIACVVARNYTASNLTFKPMIRRIEDTDDTYQSYAMTNKELTNVVNNVPGTAGTYTLHAVRNADDTITYSWV